MNYSELVAAVSSALENTFPTVDMNVFIQTAETKIYNSVQIPVLRKNVTGTTTLNNQYLTCPADFLSSYSAAVVDPVTGAYSFLVNKDVNFIRECYAVPAASGTPKYYALFGSSSSTPGQLTFILGPTPDAAYAVELHYFYYPESIVTATNTWLGDNFSPVLLYAVMVEAYDYMKGEADMMAQYKAKFLDAIGQLKRLGDGMERGDAYRDGQVKIPVT